MRHMTLLVRMALFAAVAYMATACSTASYQVMQSGTYRPGIPLASQNPTILSTVSADAPGGKTAIIVVYFGAKKAPIVDAQGDSSALVEATASVGRAAFDVAVKVAKTSAGVP